MSSYPTNETVVDARTSTPGPAFAVAIDALKSVLVVGENSASQAMAKVESGTVLGKITASGKYRPVMFTLIDGAQGPVNTFNVDDSSLFRVGDVVDITQPDGTSIDGTRNITAIPSATSITVDGAALSASDDDYVQGTDGSQTPVGILLDSTQSEQAFDDSGDAQSYDQAANLMIRGTVIEVQLTGLAAPIKTTLTGSFTFTDY